MDLPAHDCHSPSATHWNLPTFCLKFLCPDSVLLKWHAQHNYLPNTAPVRTQSTVLAAGAQP